MLNRGIPRLVEAIRNAPELTSCMTELKKMAYKSGHKNGYGEGKSYVLAGRQDKEFEFHMENCAIVYKALQVDLDNLKFGIVVVVL
ncbi:hypothetical protein Hanom_Chr06g00556431 [Helianthus anomalus]